jgi:hypothetical protein
MTSTRAKPTKGALHAPEARPPARRSRARLRRFAAPRTRVRRFERRAKETARRLIREPGSASGAGGSRTRRLQPDLNRPIVFQGNSLQLKAQRHCYPACYPSQQRDELLDRQARLADQRDQPGRRDFGARPGQIYPRSIRCGSSSCAGTDQEVSPPAKGHGDAGGSGCAWA